MKILIADDHDLLRDTLVMFLETQGDIQTTCAKDLPEAVSALQNDASYDLVLLDFNMPGMNGLDGLEHMLRTYPGVKVALMSGVATRAIAEKALAQGACGFLPKTLTAKSLVNAVKFMAMGEQYAPLEFMTAEEEVPANELAEKLSKRELQVLQGLNEGKSNKEIARDLDVQEPTVKLHMKTLYRKIGASNRTQAALLARDAGLF
jgi:DNA-binding NarL/FixJ family response regulator